MNETIHICPLSQLTEQQLKTVCELHKTEIPTLLGKLGPSFLSEYYQKAINDPDVIAISALDASGHVLGWAIGSAHPAVLTGNLRSNKLWFIKNIFKSILRDPSLIIELASQVNADPINNLLERQIELTYIGVHPDARSKGVGESLLTHFLDRARVFGANSVELSVEVENVQAIRFYQKHGFQSFALFTEGRYKRSRMILNLYPQKAIP